MTKIILAAIFGGLVCAVVQIFIDKTKLTPARILVSLASLGVLLFAVGAYEPLYEIFGCGISLPLTGFGASVARGVREAIDKDGAIGILTGGLTATSAGVTLALLLGLIASAVRRTKAKRLSRVLR